MYYRVRMKYLKWYVLLFDERLEEEQEMLDPFSNFKEAEDAGKATGRQDMDRDDSLPRGRKLNGG